MRIGLGWAATVVTVASTTRRSVTIASPWTLHLARLRMAGPPCGGSRDRKTAASETNAVAGRRWRPKTAGKNCPRYRARRIAPPVGIGTVSQVGETLPAPLQSCQGAFAGVQWRIMPPVSFDYHEPTSLADAVELGARFGADGRFLAGGTDLLIQIRRGQLAPRHLVSLHRVPGLDAIEIDGALTVGALVTHRQLERAAGLMGALVALREGAEVVGGHQIRNVATV